MARGLLSTRNAGAGANNRLTAPMPRFTAYGERSRYFTSNLRIERDALSGWPMAFGHYGGELQNSRLFAAFGVFSNQRSASPCRQFGRTARGATAGLLSSPLRVDCRSRLSDRAPRRPRFIGQRTCTSPIGSRANRAGIRRGYNSRKQRTPDATRKDLDERLLRKLLPSFPPSAFSSLRTASSCLRV